MAERVLKCPICGKPLTQNEYDKALGLWDAKQEHIHTLEAEQKKLREQQRKSREQLAAQKRELSRQALQYKKKTAGLSAEFRKQRTKLQLQTKAILAKQAKTAEKRFGQKLAQQKKALAKSFHREVQTQVRAGVEKGTAQQKAQIKRHERELQKTQNKMGQLKNSLRLSAGKYEKASAEIKRLQAQIEKGITPQIEGLLEEETLLEALRKFFPSDRFDHPGKGGDIIQTVVEQGHDVGVIVYECKKVKSYSKHHVDQAKDARRLRNADYAILVTNAFPAKKQYYFVEKTVFVISPVSLELIAHTLRESLVKMDLLRLSREAKAKAVQEVYDYLSSNSYSNRMNDVAIQLLELGKELKGEMENHKKIWVKRYKAYQGIYSDINAIDSKLRSLMRALPGKEQKLLPAPKRSFPPIDELQPQRS